MRKQLLQAGLALLVLAAASLFLSGVTPAAAPAPPQATERPVPVGELIGSIETRVGRTDRMITNLSRVRTDAGCIIVAQNTSGSAVAVMPCPLSATRNDE